MTQSLRPPATDVWRVEIRPIVKTFFKTKKVSRIQWQETLRQGRQFYFGRKGAVVSCSCRGSGTSGGLGFLPVSLCPCGASISVLCFFFFLPCLSTFNLPTKMQLFLWTLLWKMSVCCLSFHCVIYEWATRGRGRADRGDETMWRVKKKKNKGSRSTWKRQEGGQFNWDFEKGDNLI